MNRQQKARLQDEVPFGFAHMTLAGMWQMFDVQMTTLRTLAETQSRTAQAFGVAQLFPAMRGETGDHLREAMARSAEQWVGIARRAGETALRVNLQAGRVFETQVDALAQNWQQGSEQIATQAEESFRRLGETAEQQAAQLVDATMANADAVRTSLRGAGAQWQRGVDRASREASESINRTGEAMRAQAETLERAAQEVNDAEEGNEEAPRRRRRTARRRK